MQAIINGDTSGAIVHPAFTYIAQLLGCYMWQMQRRMLMFDYFESDQEAYLVNALATADPVTEIQVRYQFACYLLLKQRLEEGEQQLVTAALVVQRHRLNFPTPPHPKQLHEISDYEKELISGLSHFMYLDRCSSFVFRVPTRLDKSFEHTFDSVTVSPHFPRLSSGSPPNPPHLHSDRSTIPCLQKRTSFTSEHAAYCFYSGYTTSPRSGSRSPSPCTGACSLRSAPSGSTCTGRCWSSSRGTPQTSTARCSRHSSSTNASSASRSSSASSSPSPPRRRCTGSSTGTTKRAHSVRSTSSWRSSPSRAPSKTTSSCCSTRSSG